MQFDLKNLREILASVKNNNLKYISIKHHTFELMINKETNYPVLLSSSKFPTHNSVTNDIYQNKSLVKEKKSPSKVKKSASIDTNIKDKEIYFTIVSPMVGTFYRSPAPSEASFIELHDKVQANQAVCIIEAMKLMNEIEAEVSGTIMEIMVKDGDIVDCGQALMKIKPA